MIARARLVVLLLLVVGTVGLVQAREPRRAKLLHHIFLPLPDGSLSVFGRVISDDDDETVPLEDQRFESYFHRRSRLLPVTIALNGEQVDLRTNAYGDFEGTVPAAIAAKMNPGDTVFMTSPQDPTFAASFPLDLPRHPQTLIVSDVDDSVLVTTGWRLKKMLYHEILQDWRDRKPVPGTPEAYRRLASATANPVPLFIFLSGSPIHLAPRIEAFLHLQGFPAHALFVKRMGLREDLQQRLFHRIATGTDPLGTVLYKTEKLARFFTLYAGAPAILLGDSFGKDPETYLDIARRFPGRIKAVVIRNVSRQPLMDPRYAELRKLVPLLVWQDPATLLAGLRTLHLID